MSPVLHLAHLQENPELFHLLSYDRTEWRRCLPWHAWVPSLLPRTFGKPWAVAAGNLGHNSLDMTLGSYPLKTWYPVVS